MFRHRKIKPRVVIPVVPSASQRVVSVKDNVEFSSFVETKVEDNLPKYRDYRLTQLLESGIPLRSVNPLFDPSSRDVDNVSAAIDDLNKAEANKVNKEEINLK